MATLSECKQFLCNYMATLFTFPGGIGSICKLYSLFQPAAAQAICIIVFLTFFATNRKTRKSLQGMYKNLDIGSIFFAKDLHLSCFGSQFVIKKTI